MKIQRFWIAGFLFAAYLSLAAGPCSPAKVLSCPNGTADDGSGKNCVSSTTASASLGVSPQPGQINSTFYFMSGNRGFTLGNSLPFSTTSASNQTFTPDSIATFGSGPLPSTSVGTITETFTASVVYSATQAYNAEFNNYKNAYYGVGISDPVTGTYVDATGTSGGLTGFVVSVGYALTTSGSVVSLIARYTPRGTLDTTFNGTGYVLGSPGGFTGGAYTALTSVALDTYGNIVVGGYGNTQPTISNYLSLLQSYNGDPRGFALSGDELQGLIARYTPSGSLDTSFDTVSILGRAAGSANSGFASSPSTGFAGLAKQGNRRDVIYAVATDPWNGIYAVGSSSDSFKTSSWNYEIPIVLHYSSTGLLDSELIGSGNNGGPPATAATTTYFDPSLGPPVSGPASYEHLSAVARYLPAEQVSGTTDYLITAGDSQTATPSYHAFLAIVKLTNGGQTGEKIAYSTGDFTSGHYQFASMGTRDTVHSVAYDPNNSQYVIAGESEAYVFFFPVWSTFVATLPADEVTPPHLAAGTYYSGGNIDTLNSIAVIKNGNTVRYVGAGSSYDAGFQQHSLVVSFNPSTLLPDTAQFKSDPYYINPASYTVLPTPYVTNALPPFQSNALPPAPFYAGGGWQLGPQIPSTANGAAYGGGISEKFTAVVPSPDGTSAIVSGYTTDSATSPLTGRSFPIVLFYGIDGTFTNMGGFSDFLTLQSKL